MKLLDYQYIYLMRKRGSQKHKIGISNNPKNRHRTVNRAVDGKVELLLSKKVFFARTVEKSLHMTFQASNFLFKGQGRGAGYTEWFNFNFLERWWARLWIYFFWMSPVLITVSLALVAIYLQGNWDNVNWSWWDEFLD